MSNGRIEREAVSYDPRVRPGMFPSWQKAGRVLGQAASVWGLLVWFARLVVRGERSGWWEVAGFVTALAVVAWWTGQETREGREG